MHAANHPNTRHYREDVWRVNPREACGGKSVGLLWLSPDCRHHSRAKGGKPRKRKIRGLAWTAIRWAHDVRPRVICLENVEEFESWGPLNADETPDKKRAGQTFRAFVRKLERYGYKVEWRSLVAADYGAPTTRRRLFLVARCDGHPIVWPEPTHGKGRSKPWRTAAEIIDWSLPVKSIFSRKKPLAEATQRRIFEGLRRYLLDAATPFIVPITHSAGGVRVHGIEEPLRTVTCAHRGEFALVAPLVTPVKTHGGGGNDARQLDLPLRTVTASKRGEFALVSAFIAKHYGGVVGHAAARPLGTVTGTDHHAVVAAWLTKFYGTAKAGADVRRPAPTVTANSRGGGHLAEVRAFLVGYYKEGGSRQQSLLDPLHTITAKARFGLVTIEGQDYQIVDIGMRMLAPGELFGAQGFPLDYQIAPSFNGKPLTKTAQIACAGNSVPPALAEAVVGAQFGTWRGAVAA